MHKRLFQILIPNTVPVKLVPGESYIFFICIMVVFLLQAPALLIWITFSHLKKSLFPATAGNSFWKIYCVSRPVDRLASAAFQKCSDRDHKHSGMWPDDIKNIINNVLCSEFVLLKHFKSMRVNCFVDCWYFWALDLDFTLWHGNAFLTLCLGDKKMYFKYLFRVVFHHFPIIVLTAVHFPGVLIIERGN